MQLIPASLFILAFATGGVHAQSTSNPAYLIAEIEVTDAASLKQFVQASNPLVKAHGGEFISRGGKVITGFGPAPKAVVIIKFQTLDAAEGYYNSKEYKGILPIRDKAMKYRGYIVEGGDHPQ